MGRVGASVVVAVAVLALGAVAPGAHAAPYVALGDSYASGLGTGDVSLDTDCARSPLAYPALVAQARQGTELSFVACAGARTRDVLDEQVPALSRSTRLATVTVGGNDAGFARVLLACSAPALACPREVRAAEGFIRRRLPGRLDRVYRAIARRAPRATRLVVGYPRLLSVRRECVPPGPIARADRRRLNRTADLLARTIRRRARAAGARYVDPRGAFAGHAACDPEPWINNVTVPLVASFHPNALGHRAYADRVLAALATRPRGTNRP